MAWSNDEDRLAYNRWYYSHPEQKAKTVAYRRKRSDRRRAEFIELLGGVCAKCGTSENLEFDHIDPSTKEYRICDVVHYSRDKLEREMAKCQLLCASCHSAKTQRERWDEPEEAVDAE